MKALGVREIPIDKIEIIQGLLPRIYTHTVEEKVEEYREAMLEGQVFPPITIWDRNGTYWLIDGMHRFMASRRLGKKVIRAEVVELENELEARLLAIEKNMLHGIPLDSEERKELARLLYKDGIEIEKLRKLFRVSERTIYNWVQGIKRREKPEELREKAKELREKGYTQEEVATELGIPLGTIKRWDADKRFEPAIFADPNHDKISEEEIDFNDFDDNAVEDEISYDKLLESATKNSKELTEYAKKMFEKETNGGRPPNDLPPATETEEIERIKNALVYKMEEIALKIGWAKALPMFEEALEEIKEMSKSAKRGW